MGIVDFEAPKLYPVIHNERVFDTLKSVEQVLSAGADGVFLINHELNAASLMCRYRAVVSEFPDSYVGLNFLDMRDPADVYRYLNAIGVTPDAVWTDWYSLQPEQMSLIKRITPTTDSKRTRLFAGVSHKAANYTEDPQKSAEMAEHADSFVDYVTTTGPTTGQPVPLEKLRAIKSVIVMSKLAVASGVTPENVGDYVPIVDAILVASSLESEFGQIDPDRLQSFISAFRNSVEAEREARQSIA